METPKVKNTSPKIVREQQPHKIMLDSVVFGTTLKDDPPFSGNVLIPDILLTKPMPQVYPIPINRPSLDSDDVNLSLYSTIGNPESGGTLPKIEQQVCHILNAYNNILCQSQGSAK